MAGVRKPRKVYEIEWYDTEASNEWGKGAPVPPLAHSVGFITSWPRKNQKVPTYRLAADFIEAEPGGVRTIPAGMVKKVTYLCTVKTYFRTPKEQGTDE